MTPLSARHLMLICVCILLAGIMHGAVGSESGTITGVKVAPDGKRILVKTDGLVGQHSAFVLRNPYRLVVDFDRLGLGNTPTKFRGLSDGMEEIRLGYINGRTRLVVDFGERPAPAFTVHRVNQGIEIALGGASAEIQVSEQPRGTREAPKPIAPQPHSRGAEMPKSGDSTLVVKSATVKSDAVVIDLADSRDPKRTYRLVVELDAAEMLVRNATISDHTGNRKRFDPVEGHADKETGTATSVERRGPRKEPVHEAVQALPPGKLKWGAPSVERKQPAAPQTGAALRFPVRP